MPSGISFYGWTKIKALQDFSYINVLEKSRKGTNPIAMLNKWMWLMRDINGTYTIKET
jgi:hypothetical protein